MHTRFIVMPCLLLAACGMSTPRDDAALRELSEVAALGEPELEPAPAVVLEEVVPLSVAEDSGLPAPIQPAVAHPRYTVRRGESLAHFARWSRLPVEEIAEASSIALTDSLPVGAEVTVPIEADQRGLLEREREAHHHRRAEGYLASRGGSVGTEFYTVATGDSAWKIAHDELGLPVWLLETYNPSVDLDALRPGQQLMAPVLADVVVQVDGPADRPE